MADERHEILPSGVVATTGGAGHGKFHLSTSIGCCRALGVGMVIYIEVPGGLEIPPEGARVACVVPDRAQALDLLKQLRRHVDEILPA